jgi:uncharacterized membrane protein
MIEFLTVLNRGLSIVAVLGPAVILHWATSRGLSRANTFFAVRVQPGFSESNTGQAILRGFRRRLWSLALAIAIAVQFLPLVSLASAAGTMTTALVGWVAFALAQRRTRREAPTAAEPTVRVASLSTEGEPETAWLGLLDWLVMLVPPLIPAVTLMFLAIRGGQKLGGFAGALTVFPVFFGLILGLMCAGNQWALRFRARSSDWAPTPAASHKYRTYLGVMQGSVFTFITCQICVLVLLRTHIDMRIYFLITFPAQALWLLFVWRIHFWLTKHLATDSSDPMSDTCWKWGCVYYNPTDPALVVPFRAGIGQSFNCARPSVWVALGFLMVATVASLLQTAESLSQLSRRFPH